MKPSDLLFHGIRVASLDDIAASKVLAFSDRIISRDYVDLYFLLSRRSRNSCGWPAHAAAALLETGAD